MDQHDYPSPQSLPNSAIAVVSLVSGILGITFIPVLGSLVALITGYLARKEIRDYPQSVAGDGMAITGIILGWIGVGVDCLLACLFGVFLLLILGLLSISFSTIEYNNGMLPLLAFFL